MIPTHRAPTHPGDILLEEFLKPRQLTQVDAAAQMGISVNRLNELIRGKRGVTADTAYLARSRSTGGIVRVAAGLTMEHVAVPASQTA